ncbi:MAG TPA: cytochrome c [Burkholderiaceae bacterium]
MKTSNTKKVGLAALALLILAPLAVIAVQMLHEPGSDQRAAPVTDAQAQLARGRYLAQAGNCMGCHTVRGGAPFAGGRAISTPFGNVYATNITPDPATGLGKWSADDFWRAMHNGKGKDGSFLYPVFPYPNYTKVTRADSDAIYAYLRSVPAVKQAAREHELRFPYNQRFMLAFWRTLYFDAGEYQPVAKQNAEWNRGAYLVQGLGHCSACHTTRNALGGTASGAELAGGMIPMQNWYAASLTADAETGLGDWSTEELTDLLHTGVSNRGAAYGPMAEVVASSLQHLSEPDVRSMAVYLKTAPSTVASHGSPAVQIAVDRKPVLEEGARLYTKYCVECHKADGKGVPRVFPPLAGNRSLSVQTPVNTIRVVLNGGFAPTTKGNPQPYGMPPFGITLDDTEVAAVVSYIRTSWGNNGSLVSPVEVGRHRSAPTD